MKVKDLIKLGFFSNPRVKLLSSRTGKSFTRVVQCDNAKLKKYEEHEISSIESKLKVDDSYGSQYIYTYIEITIKEEI